MKLRPFLLSVLGVPAVAIVAQQTPLPPKSEEVYSDIQVFKGVPASDLIPAMEFMSASMKMPCSGCHKGSDYAAPTKHKDDTRRMVLLQRDINDKWFNGRLEVTCMTCHNGKEHPVAIPTPTGVGLGHQQADVNVEPEALFDKHIATVGEPPVSLTLTGTMEGPNDETRKIETNPLELIQASDGRFRLKSGTRLFGSDGKQVWYYSNVMTDEPAAHFSRIGRTWRGKDAFAGLARAGLEGQQMIAKSKTLIVRASRASTGSTEDLYFDAKSGLLVRLVNIKRSSIGNVVTAIDYSNFKKVGKILVPMKFVTTFATGDQWVMNFKTAKTDSKANDAVFQVGGE